MLKILKEDDVKFKGVEYYVSLKTKWNKDFYGLLWRDRYSSKLSVGACVWLCENMNPSSYEDFYRKYIESGDIDKDRGPKYRGRTCEEIEEIAIRWRTECGDYETPLSEYYDAIVLHTVVETYMGKDFEDKAISCLEENGYAVEHGDDTEDSLMNIDMKVYKDGKLVFLMQVKPISFIVSDKLHTKRDRINAFEKHEAGHEKYPGIPYKYLIYDPSTNKWIYNKEKERCLFSYDELVHRNGKSVRSAYAMKKYETDTLFRK